MVLKKIVTYHHYMLKCSSPIQRKFKISYQMQFNHNGNLKAFAEEYTYISEAYEGEPEE